MSFHETEPWHSFSSILNTIVLSIIFALKLKLHLLFTLSKTHWQAYNIDFQNKLLICPKLRDELPKQEVQ